MLKENRLLAQKASQTESWHFGGDPKQSSEEMSVFTGYLLEFEMWVDDGSDTVKCLLTAVQLKLVDPSSLLVFTSPYYISQRCKSVGMFGRFVLWVLFVFYSSSGSPQTQRNHPPQHRKWVFSVGIHGMQEETQKKKKTLTPRQPVQEFRAELHVSRRRVRRGLIFGTTLPPAQLERNASFHRLNWGHAWHWNNTGRSHYFPDSGSGGGGVEEGA